MIFGWGLGAAVELRRLEPRARCGRRDVFPHEISTNGYASNPIFIRFLLGFNYSLWGQLNGRIEILCRCR